MKLDSDGVWVITEEQLKILGIAERLMSTHGGAIPIDTLRERSRTSRFSDLSRELVERKFLSYKDKAYRLTISGHDCLAINGLRRRGLTAMGSPIGIGKESDIYYGEYLGKSVVLKAHRLGRTSYRRGVGERNLKGNLKDSKNWFSLNKENCAREYDFLQKFSMFSVPNVIDRERHIIVLEYLDYDPLYRLVVDNPEVLSQKMFKFILDLWNLGYVHGDFNEFNVMVKGDDIVVLDFPQCIPKKDSKAHEYLKRDIECVHAFFWRKNLFLCDDSLLADVIKECGLVISKVDKDNVKWTPHYARDKKEDKSNNK